MALLATIGARPTQVKKRGSWGNRPANRRPGTAGRRARRLIEFLEMKECPLCGESMRLHVRDVRDHPGVDSAVKRLSEWICPECDYFEEAEAGEG
jgi:hypothetical protein